MLYILFCIHYMTLCLFVCVFQCLLVFIHYMVFYERGDMSFMYKWWPS